MTADEAAPRAGRAAWIDAGWRALAQGGVAALRVEALARQLRVTKGSFYHHFEDRDALLDALLERWRLVATESVIEQADRLEAPMARLYALATLIYSPARDESVEVAIRSWASTDARAARVAAQVDARRVEYVRALLIACGLEATCAHLRARALYRMVIGDAMWRSAGEPALTPQEQADVITMILTPPDTTT